MCKIFFVAVLFLCFSQVFCTLGFAATKILDVNYPNFDWGDEDADPADIARVQFDTLRYKEAVKPFLGTYIKGSHGAENEDATFLVINGHLTLYYTVGGKDPGGSFDIPLASIGKKDVFSYHGSKGYTTVESEYSIQGNVATQVITRSTRTWKSIDRETMTVEGPHLINEHSRTHYKRKYWLTGEWVIDPNNKISQRTFNLKTIFLKLSSIPTSFDKFVEMADRRPYEYIHVIIEGGGQISAPAFRDKIESGDFETSQPIIKVQGEDGNATTTPNSAKTQSLATSPNLLATPTKEKTEGEVVDLFKHKKNQKPCDLALNDGPNILEFKPKDK